MSRSWNDDGQRATHAKLRQLSTLWPVSSEIPTSDSALKRCQGAEMTTNNGPLTRNNDGSLLCDRLTLFCHLLISSFISGSFLSAIPIHAQYTTMDFDENCGFQKIVFVTPSYGSKITGSQMNIREGKNVVRWTPTDGIRWGPSESNWVHPTPSELPEV